MKISAYLFSDEQSIREKSLDMVMSCRTSNADSVTTDERLILLQAGT